MAKHAKSKQPAVVREAGKYAVTAVTTVALLTPGIQPAFASDDVDSDGNLDAAPEKQETQTGVSDPKTFKEAEQQLNAAQVAADAAKAADEQAEQQVADAQGSVTTSKGALASAKDGYSEKDAAASDAFDAAQLNALREKEEAAKQYKDLLDKTDAAQAEVTAAEKAYADAQANAAAARAAYELWAQSLTSVLPLRRLTKQRLRLTTRLRRRNKRKKSSLTRRHPLTPQRRRPIRRR